MQKEMAEFEKYGFLPEEFRSSHDQCELLIEQIEEFITGNAYDELRKQSVNFSDQIKQEENEHFFDYLLRIGKTDEHDKIVKNQLINALIIDVCYFVQEALLCSIKKRLTVTFALLRKPFVYNLIVFLRLLFEKDFIKNFNEIEKFDSTYISTDQKKILIEKSISIVRLQNTITDEIYDFVFNRDVSNSLINLSEKALHLSTTKNKNNVNITEIQNLNFIFSDDQNIISQWDYLYRRLPFLLMYYVQIIEALVYSIIDVPKEIQIKRIEERARKVS